MIKDELSRLLDVGERHRRLLARFILAGAATFVVFVLGTVLVWFTEHGVKGTAIHHVSDAAFFTAVQLLTVSSSLPNPVTGAGQVVDVVLEAWAVLVVTAVGGSLASFFSSADSSDRA